MPQDKFESENPYVLSAQILTASKNQSALNVALNESQGPKATSVILQQEGLNNSVAAGLLDSTISRVAVQTIGDAVFEGIEDEIEEELEDQ